MRVTTWAEYGLIVSIHLARRAGQGPVAAREASQRSARQRLARRSAACRAPSVPDRRGGVGQLTRLSHEELLRYSRHLTLPDVGLQGQANLREARVVLVGAGGLGSPAAL